MIIEFVGLPGAGKSTLEEVVVGELQRRQRAVLTRQDLVQELIAEQNGVRRDADPVRRRLSTALYKFTLLNVSRKGAAGVRLPDLRHAHVRRAAMRLAESRLIVDHFDHERGVANLSEGMFQHALSLAVWRAASSWSSRPSTFPASRPASRA